MDTLSDKDTASPPPKKKRKKQRKRTRLATTTLAASSLSDVTDSNAIDSPLLRLSSELRNRIYEEALGGKYVHVGQWSPDGYRRNFGVCEIVPSADGQVPCQWSAHIDDKDHAGRQTSMDLGLLVVCRQIHNEAALLPYTLNTFAFGCTYWLGRFAHRLIVPQREALAKVLLELDLGYSRPPDKTELARTAKLTGIKNVDITLNKSCSGSDHRTWWFAESFPNDVMTLASSLEWHSGPSVNVRVCLYQHFLQLEDQELSTAEYVSSIRQAEEDLQEAWKKLEPGYF